MLFVFVVWCWLIVVRCFVCLLHVVCGLLRVEGCALFIACLLLFDVGCCSVCGVWPLMFFLFFVLSLVVVGCWLSVVVCCLLLVVG